MVNRGNYDSQAKYTGTWGMNSYQYKNLDLEGTSGHIHVGTSWQLAGTRWLTGNNRESKKHFTTCLWYDFAWV